MKALEKDRGRRYETANGLAMDVRRHLDNEPVVARPPSKLYLLQKGLRRHKVAVAVSALVAVVLLGAAGVSTWQGRMAVAAERRERIEREKAEQIAAFLEEILSGVRPWVALGRDTTILREVLDKAADQLELGIEGHPEVKADLRGTLARVYFELGEHAIRFQQGEIEKANPSILGAAQPRQSTAEPAGACRAQPPGDEFCDSLWGCLCS
jgi:eukaryotic-like serine/threonine-protein kinase